MMECNGHPAGPNDPMGRTVYCDGSCLPPARCEAKVGTQGEWDHCGEAATAWCDEREIALCAEHAE